jgi:large subunit ribosomal protein L21
MYAVFSTGGKQYRASTGDIVKVEKLEAEKGSTVELDSVLMIGEGEDVKVGTPYLSGSKVTAVVVEHGRGEKIKIIKFRRRKHSMSKTGHRQYFTALQITGIEADSTKSKASKPAEAKPEAEAKEAKAAPAKKTVAKKAASKKKVAKKAPVKKAAAKKTASKKKTAKKVAAKAPAVDDKGDE